MNMEGFTGVFLHSITGLSMASMASKSPSWCLLVPVFSLNINQVNPKDIVTSSLPISDGITANKIRVFYFFHTLFNRMEPKIIKCVI